MTNLDSLFKSRDITLLIKVPIVKAVVFLVVMYGCESWTITKYVRAKLLQLYLTFCDPMDCNPPGFSVDGIFQARILEWVAFASSKGIRAFELWC